jgi:hypothetical protein
MIESHSNLFVGTQYDEEAIRGREDWFVVSAAKFPYHKDALGYDGREAPKDHAEYAFARRPGSLILNLVDADDVKFIGPETVSAAVDGIHEHIGCRKVLVHCNQGVSRSPSIAFLYLLKFTDHFRRESFDEDLQDFLRLYPPYEPGRGMSEFVRDNWSTYVAGTKLNGAPPFAETLACVGTIEKGRNPQLSNENRGGANMVETDGKTYINAIKGFE